MVICHRVLTRCDCPQTAPANAYAEIAAACGIQHASFLNVEVVLRGAAEALRAVQMETAQFQRETLAPARGMDADDTGQAGTIPRASQLQTGATTAALAARSAVLPTPVDDDHTRVLLDVQMAVLTAAAPIGDDAGEDMGMPDDIP